MPKRCKGGKPGHAKWAITGSDFCLTHGGIVPRTITTWAPTTTTIDAEWLTVDEAEKPDSVEESS